MSGPFFFQNKPFYAAHQGERCRADCSPRGPLVIAGCRSAGYLIQRIITAYRAFLDDAEEENTTVTGLLDVDFEFSDSETCARIESHVSGGDVFLLQALYNPRDSRAVDDNYMAFLIAARAFREHGARHVTAVLPYLAYSRQDRPTAFRREPTTARLMADLARSAGIDRLVTWHLHTRQVAGFYGDLPVHDLSPLSFFVDAFWAHRDRDDVIGVAPDAGASKLVTEVCRELGVRSAVAAKRRTDAGETVIDEIVGDFSGVNTVLLMDDMVSSGGTLVGAADALVRERGVSNVEVAVSHNLCQPRARERITRLWEDGHLTRMVVTDTIPQTSHFEELPFVEIRDLAELFARVINRIHFNQSISALFS